MRISLLLLVGAAQALAFDTRGHAEATDFAAEERRFTPEAATWLRIGNFAPDFFGPIGDTVGKAGFAPFLKVLPNVKKLAFFDKKWLESGVRHAGGLMHFDNLKGRLRKNDQFAALFNALLDNTRKTIREIAKTPNADERAERVLLVLGSSLHMVQDFYSHSNWVDKMSPLRPIRVNDPALLAHEAYAVSWFAACGSGDCSSKIAVQTGVYPDENAAKDSPAHEAMNHDSRFRPSWHYVKEGHVYDHQRLALVSAARASVEWIALVGSGNPDVEQAIAAAGRTRVTDNDRWTEIRKLSCMLGHYDGIGIAGGLCADAFDVYDSLPHVTTGELLKTIVHLGHSEYVVPAGILVGGVVMNQAAGEILDRTAGLHELYTRENILEQLTSGFAAIYDR